MTKKIFQTTGAALVILGGYLFFWLSNISLEDFIDFVAFKLHIEAQKDILASYISPRLYTILTYTPITFVAIGLLLIRYAREIAQPFNYFSRELLQLIKRVAQIQGDKFGYLLACVLFLGMFIKIYLMYVMPIYYDEAWTYLYFTKLGFLSSISFYPVPNNHVLHSILTNITYYFPFSQTINLRIPNFLTSTISCILFYYTFSKLLDKRVSLSMTIIYSFSFPVLYYGYCSRGYSLVMLAFIVCFYAAINLIKKPEYNKSYRYYYYLILGNLIGLYAMPSFLYPCFAVFSFLGGYFLYKRDSVGLFSLMKSLAGTSAITILLYLPIIIFSGVDSLATNRYVAPYSRAQVLTELSEHFQKTSIFIFQIPIWGVFLLCVGIFAFLVPKKQFSPAHGLSLYIIFISPLIVIAHSTTPFPRTWVYLLIPVLFLLGYLLKYFQLFNGKLSTWGLIAFFFLIAGIQCTNFIYKINNFESFSFDAKKAASYLIEKKVGKVYINHYIVATNFLYIFEEKKLDISLVRSKNVNIAGDSLLLQSEAQYIVTDKKFEPFDNITLEQTFGEKIFIYKR